MIKKIFNLVKKLFTNNKTNINKSRKVGKYYIIVVVSLLFIIGTLCLFLDGSKSSQYTDNFVKIANSMRLLLGIIAGGVAATGIIKKIKENKKTTDEKVED